MDDLTGDEVNPLANESEALALVFNLMKKNSEESADIQNSLYASLENELQNTRRELDVLRSNIYTILHSPHTDFDLEDILYKTEYLPGRGGYA